MSVELIEFIEREIDETTRFLWGHGGKWYHVVENGTPYWHIRTIHSSLHMYIQFAERPWGLVA